MRDSYKHLIADAAETEALYRSILSLRRALLDLVTLDQRFVPIQREAIATFEAYAAEMNKAAVATAEFADRTIKALLETRIVRPPTGKKPGLAGHIVSGVWNTGAVSFAAVEVAWVEELNKAINPFARRAAGKKPYWWSQEFGSDKNVGRTIRGLFVGGASSAGPSPDLFRSHAAFAAYKKGPIGTIDNPIDAKFFLRDGTDAAIEYWRSLISIANSNCVRRVQDLIRRCATLRAQLRV